MEREVLVTTFEITSSTYSVGLNSSVLIVKNPNGILNWVIGNSRVITVALWLERIDANPFVLIRYVEFKNTMIQRIRS